jgi:hypothetical protein
MSRRQLLRPQFEIKPPGLRVSSLGGALLILPVVPDLSKIFHPTIEIANGKVHEIYVVV